MDGLGKPKYELLQQFTSILLRHDPGQLGQDNPREYEQEALSILSRFVEAALQLPDDAEAVAHVAIGIVKQALEFWFDEVIGNKTESLARELLMAYLASFKDEPSPATKP